MKNNEDWKGAGRDLEKIIKLGEVADDYCASRMIHRRIMERVLAKAKRTCKEPPYIVMERVNVPGVGRTAAIYFLSCLSMSAIVIVHAYIYDEDGNVCMVSNSMHQEMKDGTIETKHRDAVLILKRHAIERFVERSHYQGTTEEAEEYIFTRMHNVPFQQDEVTDEVIAPFDKGAFLGKMWRGALYLNTFVMNSQLYSNQRLEGIRAEQFKKNVLTKKQNELWIQDL